MSCDCVQRRSGDSIPYKSGLTRIAYMPYPLRRRCEMPGRAYEFDDSEKRGTFMRQQGMCAHCKTLLFAKNKGEWLICRSSPDVERGFAHHVVPNQVGGGFSPNRTWMMSSINCVYLCHECHSEVAHSGDFRRGIILNPEYYPYSHGLNEAAHREWAKILKQISLPVWDDVQLRAKAERGT